MTDCRLVRLPECYVRLPHLDFRPDPCHNKGMKNETAVNPYADYALEDLFYFLEEAEDAGQTAKVKAIQEAIEAYVAA